ncbi:MAG TPA: SWIM zinc finger family protein [Myxococcota bacterium]|nr:SWIM zinc finger family protein [Myxococcota bacterium]
MAYGDYYGFAPYVSVAERRKRAVRKLAQLRKKGHEPSPIEIVGRGRAIATTFWGKAWCDHLESYADFANRLPRGRTYARNGSVIDLQISRGEVRALVSGSEIYEATARVEPLATARWARVRKECAGRIGSVVELLTGKLSSAVMEVLCHREKGLFPSSREMKLRCSCPDGAWLCKHLAAVLYGVGARLDHAPELLFTLRGLDGAELVAAAGRAGGLVTARPADGGPKGEELAEIFGIEMEAAPVAAVPAVERRPRAKKAKARGAGRGEPARRGGARSQGARRGKRRGRL